MRLLKGQCYSGSISESHEEEEDPGSNPSCSKLLALSSISQNELYNWWNYQPIYLFRDAGIAGCRHDEMQASSAWRSGFMDCEFDQTSQKPQTADLLVCS